MQKLILTSLGIISIPLLFLTYTKKEHNSNISNNTIEIKDSNLELDNKNNNKKNFSISNLSTTDSKPQTIISNIPKRKETTKKEAHYLAYLNYRQEQHQLEQKKMNQYLTYQKKLQYIREGGVKSELQKERRKHEVQFQHQYQSIMMSQTKERQENFMKQNQKMKERREHLQSLKERQLLQTKYRGAL